MREIMMDDRGKIPFALIGVVLILLSTIAFAMVGQIDESGRDVSIYNPNRQTSEAAAEAKNDLSTRAHHLVLQEIHGLTKERDPDMSTLQTTVEESFEEYINNTYPSRARNSIVYLDDWSISIVSDVRDTQQTNDQFYPQDETIEPFQASPLEEGDHTNRSSYGEQKTPLYGRVMGELKMSVYSEASGHNVTYNKEFHENVYSPIFYLKGRFEEFKGESRDPFGEVGKLIRYQLSTITQTRTLFGNASGGYGENEGDIESLLTKEDVEIAVNLALLLEASRLYGDYDEDIAEKMGVDSMLENYTKNGTIDAADVFLMYQNIKEQEVDAGKVLAQAIYPFGEDFVLDLYELFWGDEIVDPTLSEPVVDWEAMEEKGEEWAEKQVRTWLEGYRDWLDIPESLDAQEASTEIRKMHSRTSATEYGSDYIWECHSTEPPRPVGGHYWVFSVGPNHQQGNWEMESDEGPDTIDLILGDPENNDLDPETYVLHFDDDFSSVPARSIEYYLVQESFIARYDQGRNTPYYDTLEYILETINRSVRQRSEDIDDVEEKGFMDTISHDMAEMVGTKEFDIDIDPEDNRSMLMNGTEYMISEEEGPINEAINEFEEITDDFYQRDEWWGEGAYKREYEDDFLYHLTSETVDLWYEAVVNLYDGGVEREGNPEGTVSLEPPEEEQRSDGESSQGTFSFRQDAMKDVNQRVRDIAIPRRQSFLDEAWETTIGQPCWAFPQCLNYRNSIIPTDAQTTWHDQAIWDRLWEDIREATEEVVGEHCLLSEDQITQELKEDMDETTDVGEYEGERVGEGNFYDFVLEHIAVRSIGHENERENMLLNLSRENGWLQHKLQETTLRDIHRNTYVNQEELFLATDSTQPRYNWRVNRTYDEQRQRVLNEPYHVEFSEYLEEDGDNLTIDIEYPKKGQHFVDVQGRYAEEPELRTNMSWSSFQTALNVSIQGTLGVNTTTSRRNIPVGVHRSTWYNGTLELDYNYTLPIHTAWPLESGWLTNDVNYQMTRSYFELKEEEPLDLDYTKDVWKPLKEEAIYVSRPLMNLTQAKTDVLSRSTNPLNSVRAHLRGGTHSALADADHTSSDLTSLMSTIDNIYYDTYNDTAYFEFIEKEKNNILDTALPDGVEKSVFEYPSMGFDLSVDLEEDILSPTYKSNRTEIVFELGEEEFSYTAQRFGNTDLKIEVDPNRDERVVIEAYKNTTLDNFSFELFYPPERLSAHEISLYDVEEDYFNNIKLPNLGYNHSVDVGIKTRGGELPVEVEDWFTAALEDKNNSYDGFIHFTKDLLKEMHEELYKEPELFQELDEIGFYFHVNESYSSLQQRRFIYWTNSTTQNEMIEYVRLFINDIRFVGRNLGINSPAPSLFTRTDENMLNNYSFEIIGPEGNYTRGNFAWWASAEPSIGIGRKADFFTAELGRTVLDDEEEKTYVDQYHIYENIFCLRE